MTAVEVPTDIPTPGSARPITCSAGCCATRSRSISMIFLAFVVLIAIIGPLHRAVRPEHRIARS